MLFFSAKAAITITTRRTISVLVFILTLFSFFRPEPLRDLCIRTASGAARAVHAAGLDSLLSVIDDLPDIPDHDGDQDQADHDRTHISGKPFHALTLPFPDMPKYCLSSILARIYLIGGTL
jgi:hypothetical protein